MVRDTSFGHSVAIQGRVLRALLLREVITRFGRHNLGVLWLFIEPMIFTLGVMTLWAVSGMRHGAGMPIAAFAITGYSSVLLWRNCATRSGVAIEQNINLLYHRNVRVLDVLLTRIIIELVGATASFAILSVVFIAAGLMAPPVDTLRVLAGWIMLAWFGASLALVIGAGTAYNEMVERLWHPAAYLLFPLSGAAFMVDWMPANLRQFVLYVPMVHGVEMLRSGYFGNAVRTHYDVAFMAIVCLVLTWVGLHLARAAGRRIEVR
jgi:capsular polysaccharide transport system permease protein